MSDNEAAQGPSGPSRGSSQRSTTFTPGPSGPSSSAQPDPTPTVPANPFDELIDAVRTGKTTAVEALEQGSKWLSNPSIPGSAEAKRGGFFAFTRDLHDLNRQTRVTQDRGEQQPPSGGGAGDATGIDTHEPPEEELGTHVRTRRQREDDGSDQEEEDDLSSNKKQRIFKSDMPFKASGRLECRANCERLTKYANDPKRVREWVQEAEEAPPAFPDSEWDHIIRGRAVNLDAVLSERHALQPAKEEFGRLGNLEFSLPRTEPAKHIHTAHEWSTCWATTAQATSILFPSGGQSWQRMDSTSRISSQLESRNAMSKSLPMTKQLGHVSEAEESPFSPTEPNLRAFVTLTSTPEASTTDLRSSCQVPTSRNTASCSTARKGAPSNHAGTCTPASNASSQDMGSLTAASETRALRLGRQPKYHRYQFNAKETKLPALTADWTLNAEPVPPPPPEELSNPVVNKTIAEYPHLFRVWTPINVQRFSELLASHPNQPFVQSVIQGLKEGFWPWARARRPGYPETLDASLPASKDPEKSQFLIAQRDEELAQSRYSATFGPDLLPGMYSMPIHAVPKPGSDTFRLVTDMSFGEHSPNSMCEPHDAGFPMDNISHLGRFILQQLEENPDVELVLHKTDVMSAYRIIPVHPCFQTKCVNTVEVNGRKERNVDWFLNFGGTRNIDIFIAFMSLVLWIARDVKGIKYLCGFVDDSFGTEIKGDVLWYPRYRKYMPTAQAKLLLLFDELGIPHKESKQISGQRLPIIGIQVDIPSLTLSLPEDSRLKLLEELKRWIAPGRKENARFSGKEYQKLAGWINWGFNAHPLMKPSLNNVYPKMSDKTRSQRVWTNYDLRDDLAWLASYLESNPGAQQIRARSWDPEKSDVVAYTDACIEGLGVYFPEANLGFYSPIPYDVPSEWIYHRELLAVTCAIDIALSGNDVPTHMAVWSDNTNTVNAMHSFKTPPFNNRLLRHIVDLLLHQDHRVQALYIPGEENVIADALSRRDFEKASLLSPGIQIDTAYRIPKAALSKDRKYLFATPSIKAGGNKK